jgi:polyhydroxyalkanoate synthesis repressor PhaR
LSEDHILITRYSSRRLYNTHSSEYITLEEVYSLIKEGKNIKIIDKQTQEDLTKQYLLQIISDIENKEGNVFPENMLTDIIKSYSDATQKIMPDMVAKSFEFFKNQQSEFLKHLNTKDINPFLDETTSEVVKDWQSKQYKFMNDLFNPLNNDEENEKSTLSQKEEIEILKKQMSQLQEELNKKKSN